jgi:hypothetical protein
MHSPMCDACTGAEGGSGSDSDADGDAPVAPSKGPKKAAPVPAAAAPEPTTDVSAWDLFGLHPGILRALALKAQLFVSDASKGMWPVHSTPRPSKYCDHNIVGPCHLNLQ